MRFQGKWEQTLACIQFFDFYLFKNVIGQYRGKGPMRRCWALANEMKRWWRMHSCRLLGCNARRKCIAKPKESGGDECTECCVCACERRGSGNDERQPTRRAIAWSSALLHINSKLYICIFRTFVYVVVFWIVRSSYLFLFGLFVVISFDFYSKCE